MDKHKLTTQDTPEPKALATIGPTRSLSNQRLSLKRLLIQHRTQCRTGPQHVKGGATLLPTPRTTRRLNNPSVISPLSKPITTRHEALKDASRPRVSTSNQLRMPGKGGLGVNPPLKTPATPAEGSIFPVSSDGRLLDSLPDDPIGGNIREEPPASLWVNPHIRHRETLIILGKNSNGGTHRATHRASPRETAPMNDTVDKTPPDTPTLSSEIRYGRLP